MEQESFIKIKGLSKKFAGEGWALKNIDIAIDKGEIVGIIGESGAGKSTLLRCLNGLETPTEGFVKIDGLFDLFGDAAEHLLGKLSVDERQLPHEHVAIAAGDEDAKGCAIPLADQRVVVLGRLRIMGERRERRL